MEGVTLKKRGFCRVQVKSTLNLNPKPPVPMFSGVGLQIVLPQWEDALNEGSGSCLEIAIFKCLGFLGFGSPKRGL